MTPRSQVVTALAVLLIGLVAVLALVGDAGVQTSVFSADATLTPSPIPVPVASADNWAESETDPGVWTYTADPGLQARITVVEKTIEQTATDLGVPVPEKGAAMPGLLILGALSGDLQDQIASQPDAGIALDGPATRLYNGQPVSMLRFSYGPDLNPSFPRGIDVALGFIDLGDERLNSIEYFADTNSHDAAYADFETWLIANIDRLSGAGADTDTETEADTDPDAASDAQSSAADQTWLEIAPGQLIYAANQNVVVMHRRITVDELVTGLGLDSEDDPPTTPIELLEAMQADFQTRYQAIMGVEIPAEAFTGPANVTHGGVQMAELTVNLAASTDPDSGQELPVQLSRQFLIDLGGSSLHLIQFIAQGDIDETVEADFEAWLSENAPVFAETEPAGE